MAPDAQNSVISEGHVGLEFKSPGDGPVSLQTPEPGDDPASSLGGPAQTYRCAGAREDIIRR